MDTTRKRNQGFSLIELLIAMTILSIVMVMVVQFMSTTSGAYQKNKKNLNLQTDSMQIMEQISDTLMQANYIRIQTKDKGMYTITRTYESSRPKREIAVSTVYPTNTEDFVPDNYGNYAIDSSYDNSVRKAIVDFDNFQILDESSGSRYPLSTDGDYSTSNGDVVSFRKMKKDDKYQYVKPDNIYVEYPTTEVVSGVTVEKTEHVMYHITDVVDDNDDTCAIYMIRYKTNSSTKDQNFAYAKSLMYSYLTSAANHGKGSADASTFTNGTESDVVRKALREQQTRAGLVTDHVSDFYISADSEGNAILFDVLFKNGGYEYNCVDTVICRNSNVLTVRPQKLFKKKGTGIVPAASGGGESGGGESGGGESGGGESGGGESGGGESGGGGSNAIIN